MTRDENPDAVDHEARRLRDDYGVGFVKLGEGSLEVWGSGTLVSVRGQRAVLTAHHVVTNLGRLDQVGLLCPNRRNESVLCPRVSMSDTVSIPIAPASMTQEGPDLALLILPPSTVGTLAAHKSFYNLDAREQRMRSSPPDIDSGSWLLAGSATEWAERIGDGNPWFDFKVGRTAIGPPVVRDGFDYVDAGSLVSEETDSPSSFGGFSGGALWQLVDAGDGEVHSYLSGVCFFQSEQIGGVRRITCHFRSSIYERLLDAFGERTRT